MALIGFAPALALRADAGPVLLGLYSRMERDLSNINSMLDVDAWLAPTGKRTAIVGLFLDVETPPPSVNVPLVLDAAWNNGYVPFVNLHLQHQLATIASGLLDGVIREWARHFAIWSSNGQRRAFIAPLHEMNGYWEPYYGDPLVFRQVFRRIRQIFEEELISHGASIFNVQWVLAANGWGDPPPPWSPGFESYYPGHDVVDVVSVNDYNFGACVAPGAPWVTFDMNLPGYLDRLLVMTEGRKPLFIAETATVKEGGDKDQWLQELFTRLAAYPRFRGVVYFNINSPFFPTLPGCPLGADYRLHEPGTNRWSGFWNAMATLSDYVYWAPDSPEMANIVFGRQPAQIFADVPTIHPFAREPGEIDFSPWIHAVFQAGVTVGCGGGNFCPNSPVTRAEMAVFLLRGRYGSLYSPPDVTATRFDDVPPGYWAEDFIEQLAVEGITGGCGGGNFCPEAFVTRAQMAVFLLRGRYGSLYSPPDVTATRFGDVPPGYWAEDFIEQLAVEGITGGCGAGNFCPEALVTRAQMAVFLVRAFNLAL
jgi:hypothetical protein